MVGYKFEFLFIFLKDIASEKKKKTKKIVYKL